MTLSTLIVQREIVTVREVEEAVARQVLYGGDFVTNLFEVSRIEEAALMPVVAELFGLVAAPAGELPRPTDAVTRLVTGEVAAERGIAPLDAGASLVVAVAEPLAPEVEQELNFALALPIEQRIAPAFRIRQALARDYGIPIDRRTARLLTKIVTRGPVMNSGFPPQHKDSTRALRAPPRPPSAAPPPAQPQVSAPPPQTTTTAQGTFVRKTDPPQPRPMRRRRGPLPLDAAKEELEASAERDVILDVLFEFARQFFDYTVLFTVHGEYAEGRDAFGDGASRDKVARIRIPVDHDNVLTAARRVRKPFRTKPSRHGLDPILMADLGRSGITECVVFPVVVRTRVVALVFGDGGPSGIDDAGVRQVELLATSAAGAFERVILRRKKEVPSADQPPPTQISAPPGPEVQRKEERPSPDDLAPPLRELLESPLSAKSAPSTTRDAPPPPPPPPPPRPSPIASAPFVSAPIDLPGGLTPPPGPRSGSMPGSLQGPTSTPMSVPAPSDRPPPANILAVRRPSGQPIPREEPEVPNPAPTPRPVSARTRSGAHKRAAAPSFEFGVPSIPSVTTESSRAPNVTNVSEAPKTTRDPPPVSAPPHSPRAISPPEMRAVAVVTDLSPPILPRSSGPITPITDPSPPMIDVGKAEISTVSTSSRPPVPVEQIDPTPIVPNTFENEELDNEDLETAEPVLPLSSRRLPPPAPKAKTPKPMPASEQKVSLSLHRPPISHSDHTRVLPSVIVDTSSEYVALVDRVIAGRDDQAESALLRAGGYAMPAIMAKFPGPIVGSPDTVDGVLPRVSDCGPVLRLVASQRRTALPAVLALVESANREHRFWATYLLTELVYPDAVQAAVGRVFDEEARTRRVACAAVRALAEIQPMAVVDRLAAIARKDTETWPRRIQAIDALGESREQAAVAVLIPLLEAALGDVAVAVRLALMTVTRQDFGLDYKKWSIWWEQHKTRHRIEWLISALMHEHRALRAAASEELRVLTKEYFGYYDDLPKRERERAQARYREWWETVGRVRFSRAATRR